MDHETAVPVSDPVPAEAQAPPARRPWHAPQFMMTEIAATDAMSGGTNDGFSFGS